MHYVPESARAYLTDQSAPNGKLAGRKQDFHYQSAPLYLATAVVGGLLGADLLIRLTGDPAWDSYGAPLGIRLSLLAAVFGGARILYQSLEGLFEGRIGADLALTVAALAAIVLGEYQTAAFVVFIALCGESIEGYTLDRAQLAIHGVFNLCPELAHVVRDEREIDVPIEEVQPGDVLTIRPGERLPVDGVVIAGVSTVDQSALTGESVPVDKGAGDTVYTGTLNQFGSLSVTANKMGADTTLAHVVALVAAAARQKTPLERTADRLAGIFLPFVLAAALMTLGAWRLWSGAWSDGFRPALGVLVVACPCPLILATPTAVLAAMAWLARKGAVVKGSIALERLAAIDTIAFDKTGTLTRGELRLERIVAIPPLSETELLRVAAIAERRSEHLLARLIVREAESRNLVVPAVDDFVAHPGSGVVAKVRSTMLGPWADGFQIDSSTGGMDESSLSGSVMHTVVVGNRALLQSRNASIAPEIERQLAPLEQSGATTLLVAVDDRVVGALGVGDTIREESRDVLRELRQSGIRSFALLTGDRPEPAQAVADRLGGFDTVEAGLFPADKARWIVDTIAAGRRVAMVGDGINDAPALAAASVGLALGGVGSDIAADAGDIVLMGDPLRPLPGLLRLSRALVRNIRQSILIFAFGMNALGILLCATGILNPIGAALFHEFSSLAVMLNAMRLLWFERWDQTALGRSWLWFTAGADWTAEALSPTRLVFSILENRSLFAGVALPLAALAWLTTGIVCIRENERAVVTRFGRAEADLLPGLYWRLPFPLERIDREPVGRLRALPIGFRRSEQKPLGDSAASTAPIEWTSEHKEAGFDLRPEESLVLTGDEVLVEMTAEVQWRIANLRSYLFDSTRPLDTLRTLSETVLREMAARQPLDGILTERRRQIERDCLAILRDRLKKCPLGIEVVSLSLLDVHPPREVVPAYRDVADALEEQEERVNQAEAYYAGRLLGAAGERAVRILNQSADGASKHSDQSVTGAITDWTLTDAIWSRLTNGEIADEPLLSGESASILLSAREAATGRAQAAIGTAARFNALLGAYRMQPKLTGSHLYWRAIVDSLSERAVTVIDPRAAGHKRLFLGGPDELRANAAKRDAAAERVPAAPQLVPAPNSSSYDPALQPEQPVSN